MGQRISFIFGTRPEAIKLCPIIKRLEGHSVLTPHVCVTGQHREMLDQILQTFGVSPDVDLDLMAADQTLPELTAKAVIGVSNYLDKADPRMVIVQGDTTTAFSAAMAAFYKKIPVSHVEAGLRTWNRFAPFPEEMNRVLISRLAGFHFCPTPWSRDNLLKEGIGADRIIVTGNTVVDAIQAILGRVRKHPPDISSLANTIFNRDRFSKFVLITGHRRENFGAGFKNVCAALSALAEQFSSTAFVYPLHLNPNVQKPVREMLGHSGNIFLIPPQDYLQFVYLMDYSDFIITDSGGVQEEAPSLGKPVLVMRESTERPEAVQSGNVKIVGTSVEKIVSNAKRLLTDEDFYRSMSIVSDVYGDGKASIRIIDAIARHFSNPTRNTEPVDA